MDKGAARRKEVNEVMEDSEVQVPAGPPPGAIVLAASVFLRR